VRVRQRGGESGLSAADAHRLAHGLLQLSVLLRSRQVRHGSTLNTFDFENDALPRQAQDVRNTENTAVLRSKKLLPLFREIPDLLPNVRNRPTNTIK
jgi:hypothetical protein